MKAHFIMSVMRHSRNKNSHVPKLAKVPVWDEKDEAIRSEIQMANWERMLMKQAWKWHCKF